MVENNVPEYNNKRTNSQPCQTLSTADCKQVKPRFLPLNFLKLEINTIFFFFYYFRFLGVYIDLVRPSF